MKLAALFERLVGEQDAMAFGAYDGSRAGSADAPARLVLCSPRALRYLAASPGELGLARAYVSGELDVEGDMYAALAALATQHIGELSWGERARIVRDFGPSVLRPLAPPPEEVHVRGLRHSKRRDAEAVAHHYDVSNRFYSWVLGPSMAYTCAVYERPDATLEQAQEAKFELVSRKLALQPGMRLLDVGCGWGGMVMHAAEHHGVRALGVTLSRQQAERAQKDIAERGLGDLAEVRHLDYRDVAEGDFDAVSSIGLTEHIGARNLPAYFRSLHARLRPGGRLLNHCITRPTTRERARDGQFLHRYVFPDGELLGVGTLAGLMQDHGFEVRHVESLREHYALTLRDWGRNLDAHWDEAVEEVGFGRARVWRLYMAASRLGFDRDNVELHQLLGVRRDGGRVDWPLRPDWA